MIRALVLLIPAMIAGCGAFSPPLTSTHAVMSTEVEYQHALALKNEKKYAEAVDVFMKISAASPSAPESADALFEIAYLRVVYDNPQRDYMQALALFEEFLKRYPLHPRSADAATWRLLLKMFADTRKENDQLNRSIEQLKRLDIRHEERRGR